MHLLLQESDGVSCSVRQCTVLLKDITPPWDLRNMSIISFLARKRIIAIACPIHFDTRLDKIDFSTAIDKLLFKCHVKFSAFVLSKVVR